MQISYKWLKQFIKTDKTVDEISVLLTDLGLEVEGVSHFQNIKGGLKGFVVGEVVSCEKHQNADKLKLTKVKISEGEEPLQIVCGAPNVSKGQKVALATIGTEIHLPNGESFTIKKSKIRGEESFGMLCSEVELNIGNANDGIAVLPEEWEVGTPLSEKYEIYEDTIFEIGLTPNRSDAMSHWGVARDLRAALIQENKGTYSEIITPSITKFKVDKRTRRYDIEIEKNELCPRFCGITIDGIDVKESPEWLKNKLKAIGLTPKNNIVDITNYVMHDLGQPLHAYDSNKISGNKVIVRHANAEEKITTLDGIERSLDTEDIVVADESQVLGIAGVMGGNDSSVTKSTQSIFLESAYFDAVSVRKTSKRHTINSDASFRFERGIDPDITAYALKYATILITELAGGEVSSDLVEYYPKKIENESVILYIENIKKIIGTEIPQDTIIKILTSLDFKINHSTTNNIGISIPAYRTDVTREIDVIEEILRVYGFNNIPVPEKITASVSPTSILEDYKLQKQISQQLVTLGFHEIMSNSLTTPTYYQKIEEIEEKDSIEILNPLSSELSVMRRSLLFGGLEAINYNINRKNTDLKFFEYGKVYRKRNTSYKEEKQLALFATGLYQQTQWNSQKETINFFHFKAYIESIFDKLGVKIKQKPCDLSIYSESIQYECGGKVIAHLGVVAQNILKGFQIKQEVFYAEIFWEELLGKISPDIRFKELSKYPPVKRDLALTMDLDTSYSSIYETIMDMDINMLKDIQLFDVYQGDQLPEGKKSYAISLKLQLDSHTLTDKEIDATMNKIMKNLETKLQISLR